MDVVANENGKPEITWRTVDGTLRAIAKRRTELDAHEARWLRRAMKLEVWKPLGMVSMIDYMDRVLDYAPHTARERLRVAEALGALSQLGGSLARGELPYSAIRELSRIVVPTTQSEWIAAAKGRSQREIEKLVSGRKKGSRPSDPADPDLRTRPVRFELTPTLYAKYRQARRALDEEHGRHLDDHEMFGACLDAVLDGTAAIPNDRARNQIALTICEICRQGWQRGGGRQIAVDAATVERAECDAVHIGSIHAMVPARAYQDISPAVRRLIMERDGGCCRVPGCRSSRGIECHHLKPRAEGGAHDPSNIVLLCGLCRARHKPHYADCAVMPRSVSTPTRMLHLYAA